MNITIENYQQADNAIRDILYMFFDMARSYRGFGHNIETGSFNPFDFLDSQIVAPPGQSFSIDQALLHGGAGISMLCTLSNAWDEEQMHSEASTWIKSAKESLVLGRANHLPEIQLTLVLGFGPDEEKFRKQLEVVYRKYVGEFRWEN